MFAVCSRFDCSGFISSEIKARRRGVATPKLGFSLRWCLLFGDLGVWCVFALGHWGSF